MKKCYMLVSSIFAILFFASCQYIPSLTLKEVNESYVKKTEAEANIAQLEKDHAQALMANTEKITSGQSKVISSMGDQLQAGADGLYSIQQATIVLPSSGAVEFIKNRTQESFIAMGRSPTIKEIVEGGERLKKYLTTYQDNDPVKIASLQKEHDDLIKQNGILVETTKAAEKSVEVAKAEKLEIEQKYITDNTKAQTQLNLANNNVIDKEKQRAIAAEEAKKAAEDWKAAIHQIMLWCGIGSVLALVGAVYSPVGKGGLAMIAGVLAMATIALPFVQPWMIWILLGVVIVGVGAAIFVFLKNHNLAEVSNNNMIHAIDDTKQKAGATIDDLKANLSAWNTKYVKDVTGNIISVADNKVENYIRSKLIQSGRLDVSVPPSGSFGR